MVASQKFNLRFWVVTVSDNKSHYTPEMIRRLRAADEAALGVAPHFIAFAKLEQEVSQKAGTTETLQEILERNTLDNTDQRGSSDDLTINNLRLYIPVPEQVASGYCLLGLIDGVLHIATPNGLSTKDRDSIVTRLKNSSYCVASVETVLWSQVKWNQFARNHSHDAGQRLPSLVDHVALNPDDGEAVTAAVNDLLDDALIQRASDIHLDFEDAGRGTIYYRTDGDRHPKYRLPNNVMGPIVARLKTMAKVDVSETRYDQDGHLTHSYEGRDIDIRLGAMPSDVGGSLTLRLLDRANLIPLRLSLAAAPDAYARLMDVLRRPTSKESGLILFSGPVGSGKTTSLYGFVMAIDRLRRKVWVVGNPVEYRFPLLQQLSIADRTSMSMGRVFRGFLRHDSDYIAIEETRDSEACQCIVAGLESSNTIITTVHAPNCAQSISRVVEFLPQSDRAHGSYLIGSALQAALNQRLVKRVCRTCGQISNAEDVPGLIEMLPEIEPTDEVLNAVQGTDCTICRGTGFVGRTLALEYLLPPISIDARQEIVNLILNRQAEKIRHVPGVLYQPFSRDYARLIRTKTCDPTEIMYQLALTSSSADHD